MPRRQQRTSGLRRNIPVFSVPQYPTFDWDIAVVSETQIKFFPFIFGTTVVDTETVWTTFGVLQMQNLNDDQYPVSMVKDGNGWLLNYAAPMAPTRRFFLAPADPAIRGAFGALAISKTWIETSTPVVGNNSFVAAVSTGTGVNVEVSNTYGANFMTTVPPFQNQTTSEYASAVVLSGTTVIVTFPSVANPGDSIWCPGSGAFWLNQSGGNIDNNTLVAS